MAIAAVRYGCTGEGSPSAHPSRRRRGCARVGGGQQRSSAVDRMTSMTGFPVTITRTAGDELDIQLLGGFQVRVGGVPLGDLRSSRARSLLAFVVLAPSVAHSRHALAAMFWPDSSGGQARTNLRNVLHLLRHAARTLDVGLHASATTLEWRPVGLVGLDVQRFEAALAAVSDADPDDPDVLIAERLRATAEATGDARVAATRERLAAPS